MRTLRHAKITDLSYMNAYNFQHKWRYSLRKCDVVGSTVTYLINIKNIKITICYKWKAITKEVLYYRIFKDLKEIVVHEDCICFLFRFKRKYTFIYKYTF